MNIPNDIKVINIRRLDIGIPKDIIEVCSFEDLLSVIRQFDFKLIFKQDNTYNLIAQDIVYFFETKKIK